MSNPPTSLQYCVLAVMSILKTLLPALLLGAIVFKVIVAPKVITFRRKVSLYVNQEFGQNVLAIRVYSSTRLSLLNIDFAAVGLLTMIREENNAKHIRHVKLKTMRKSIPYLQTHIPFTLYIPLEPNDLIEHEGIKRLFSVQGHQFQESMRLLVILSGRTPEIGTEFIETHSYVLPDDLQWGKYSDIELKYEQGIKPSTWSGWENFEDTDVNS